MEEREHREIDRVLRFDKGIAAGAPLTSDPPTQGCILRARLAFGIGGRRASSESAEVHLTMHGWIFLFLLMAIVAGGVSVSGLDAVSTLLAGGSCGLFSGLSVTGVLAILLRNG